MKLIWLTYFIELMVYLLLKDRSSDSSFFLIFMTIFHSLIVIFSLIKSHYKTSPWLILGYLLRLLIMLLDIFSENITIPYSGIDTENFYRYGMFISENIEMINEINFGGMYTKFLGIIFYIFGNDKIVPQYINVLLGLSSIMVIDNIQKKLSIEWHIRRSTLIVQTIFPHLVIFSSLLLRESLLIFIIVLAVYFALEWIISNKYLYLFFSSMLFLLATTLHTGVFSLLAGLLLFYILKSKLLSYKLNIRNIFLFSVLIIILLFIFRRYGSIVFQKLLNYTSIDDLSEVINTRGGSAYLQALNNTSLTTMLLYSPIYIFYFLFSPLPFDWRNIIDILVFILDSSVYLFLSISIVKNYNISKNKRTITEYLFISVILFSFLFSITVHNTGTAIRHRIKIFEMLILLYSIVKSKNIKGKYEKTNI